jgi:hypothetical protein
MIKCLAPAHRRAARCIRLERVGLMHGELRLAFVFVERDHGHNILTVANVAPENDSRRLNALDMGAVERVVLAIRSAHREAKNSARAKVHLASRHGESH